MKQYVGKAFEYLVNMKFRTRLTLTFGIFALFLCSLFALLLNASLTALEDQIVISFLRQEVEFLHGRYKENPEQLVMPQLNELKGYLSTDSYLPKWLEGLEKGIHETTEHLVLVQDFDNDLRVYLVYHESSGLLDRYEGSFWITLGLLILLVSLVGIGLGLLQARVLANPINKLADQVSLTDLRNPQISPLPNNDEIGFLSRAYADLINRLAKFIQREKAFTRYASHELKTPLSVLKNNLELLRNENANADLRQRSVDRISKAADQMHEQIDIFLVLAREQKLESSEHAVDWNRLLSDVAAQFPHISLSLVITQQPEIFVNHTIVQTIFSNVLSSHGCART